MGSCRSANNRKQGVTQHPPISAPMGRASCRLRGVASGAFNAVEETNKLSPQPIPVREPRVRSVYVRLSRSRTPETFLVRFRTIRTYTG
jgi:hypothetical protein